MKTAFDKSLEELLQNEDVESVDDLDDEDYESKPMEIIEYDHVNTSVQVLEGDSAEERDRKEDYVYARNIYRGMLSRGISALELALIMAKDSEHPKAIDSVSNLMKSIGDLNKDLIKLHDKKETKQRAETITNNTQVNHYNVANDQSKIEDFLDKADDDDSE